MKGKRVFVLVSILLLGIAARPTTSGEPREHRRKLADHSYLCIQSLESLRAVQTAIDAYAVDHSTYPRVNTMEELRSMVQPDVHRADSDGRRMGNAPSLRRITGRPALLAGQRRLGSRVRGEELGDSARSSPTPRCDAVLTSEGWATDREWVIQE